MEHFYLHVSVHRDPNGLLNTAIHDWPLYTYPERAHIVLDVFNKSTGIALRADYCAFWEHYIPILLEEFGKKNTFICFCKKTISFLLERCVLHGPSSSLTIPVAKSSCSLKYNSFFMILILFLIIIEMK
jgi:hypothetical protein